MLIQLGPGGPEGNAGHRGCRVSGYEGVPRVMSVIEGAGYLVTRGPEGDDEGGPESNARDNGGGRRGSERPKCGHQVEARGKPGQGGDGWRGSMRVCAESLK